MQKIILEMDNESMTLGATAGMTVAEINLWLDVAKGYLISQGSRAIDFTIPAEESPIKGTVGPPASPVQDTVEEASP